MSHWPGCECNACIKLMRAASISDPKIGTVHWTKPSHLEGCECAICKEKYQWEAVIGHSDKYTNSILCRINELERKVERLERLPVVRPLIWPAEKDKECER